MGNPLRVTSSYPHDTVGCWTASVIRVMKVPLYCIVSVSLRMSLFVFQGRVLFPTSAFTFQYASSVACMKVSISSSLISPPANRERNLGQYGFRLFPRDRIFVCRNHESSSESIVLEVDTRVPWQPWLHSQYWGTANPGFQFCMVRRATHYVRKLFCRICAFSAFSAAVKIIVLPFKNTRNFVQTYWQTVVNGCIISYNHSLLHLYYTLKLSLSSQFTKEIAEVCYERRQDKFCEMTQTFILPPA